MSAKYKTKQILTDYTSWSSRKLVSLSLKLVIGSCLQIKYFSNANLQRYCIRNVGLLHNAVHSYKKISILCWAESDVSLRVVAGTVTDGVEGAMDLGTTPVVPLTAAVRRGVFTVFVAWRRSVTLAAPVSTRDKPQPVPRAATTSGLSFLMLLLLLLKLRDWWYRFAEKTKEST